MTITSLFLTAAMCIPVGGRKEIVSMMHEQSEKISYLSGKMAEMTDTKELFSLWNESGENTQTAFIGKTLIDREEKFGILDKDIASNAKEFCRKYMEDDYRVTKLEEAFFGGKIASSGIMREYDDNCSSFIETVEKADTMEAEKPAEQELKEQGVDLEDEVLKNYSKGIFPIYKYDPEKVEFLFNGTYYGEPFIGLRVSEDACISFVDSVDSFFNDYIIRQGFSKSLNSIAIQLSSIMPAVESFMRGVAIDVATLSLYVHSLIGPLWSKIVAFFSTNPIGLAITAVLTFLALATITILVEIFACGCQKLSFMTGFIVHGWFNIEPVHVGPMDQELHNRKPVVFS